MIVQMALPLDLVMNAKKKKKQLGQRIDPEDSKKLRVNYRRFIRPIRREVKDVENKDTVGEGGRKCT